MNYTVNAYGGGTKEEIVIALRQLADYIEQDTDTESLDGDGYEVNNLRIDFEEAE